jgi:signal transduction histidine kinase
MSVSVSTATATLPKRPRTPSPDPPRVMLLEWSVALPTMAVIAWLSISDWSRMSQSPFRLLVWGVMVAAVDLLPVRYSDVFHQTMGLPVLLAAGMQLPAQEVALLAFVACWDPRELRREIGLGRALFNRSHIALSASAASLVFHALGGSLESWPSVIVVAIVALVADIVINWTLVLMAASLATQEHLSAIVSGIFLGSATTYVLTYAAVGLLALLIASADEAVGNWGLVASVAPLALARQVFLGRTQTALSVSEAIEKEELLAEMSGRIADERRDERARIAMSLHDEVLPAIFEVHLMGEVLRQDLDSGRLLDLEADIPQLRIAANGAANLTRTLISSLRRSAIGPAGLASTLRLLIEELSIHGPPIRHQVEEIEAAPLTQLLIYQVAREALRNAVLHANAAEVSIRLFVDGPNIRLIVSDDGIGFVPSAAARDLHFGLRMMAERAEQAGGLLHIQSCPGQGTQITGRFPRH